MLFRGAVRRTTLADANERRDWRIFAGFAQGLITEARQLYAKDTAVPVSGSSDSPKHPTGGSRRHMCHDAAHGHHRQPQCPYPRGNRRSGQRHGRSQGPRPSQGPDRQHPGPKAAIRPRPRWADRR
ncbi:MAG TPA: hypothetical protein DCS97_00855 [Planctomycetes bacterium]|nr:hypothetical protein [Planctomycetota bacterium]